MTFIPIGTGQAQAWRVANYLRARYCEWTADLKSGRPGIPYLKWKDDGARDAYWILCALHKLPREA